MLLVPFRCTTSLSLLLNEGDHGLFEWRNGLVIGGVVGDLSVDGFVFFE